MNNYEMQSISYKLLLDNGKIDKETAEKHIRVFDFLAACDQEDKYILVDSSAFNDIITGYVKIAVEQAGVSEEVKNKILNNMYYIFDFYNAEKAMASYLDD